MKDEVRAACVMGWPVTHSRSPLIHGTWIELNGIAGVDDAPGLGHRVSVYSRDGQRVALFGAEDEGEGPGEFIAPHGIAVDSRGDIYVGEVANTIRGRELDPPRELKTLKKLRRTS